jgi:hypothetical protein
MWSENRRIPARIWRTMAALCSSKRVETALGKRNLDKRPAKQTWNVVANSGVPHF